MSLLNLQLCKGVTSASGRATIFRNVHVLACACAAVAGCGRSSEPADQPVRQAPQAAEAAPAAPVASAPVLLVDGGGLVIRDADGKRRVIAFGSPAADALAAARRLYGEPQSVEMLEECGAGPLQASRFSGLTLAAQDGKFAGWWTDATHKPPLPTTERGIGIGSARAALAAAYSIEAIDSSLGDEFNAGGLAGLTDGEGEGAKVTHLWAGATCIMR